MPFSFRIDKDDFVVLASFEDILGDEEACSFVSSLRAEPDLRSSMPVLIDATGLTGCTLTQKGVKSVVDILQHADKRRSEARTAVVSTRTGIALAADMLGLAIENRGMKYRVRTFPEVTSARTWLRETPVFS